MHILCILCDMRCMHNNMHHNNIGGQRAGRLPPPSLSSPAPKNRLCEYCSNRKSEHSSRKCVKRPVQRCARFYDPRSPSSTWNSPRPQCHRFFARLYFGLNIWFLHLVKNWGTLFLICVWEALLNQSDFCSPKQLIIYLHGGRSPA